MGDNYVLYGGIVVALILGAIVGYVIYPPKPLEKGTEVQQDTPTYSTNLRLDDLEQKIFAIQWRGNGMFFMALVSLCLGVWNYFQSSSRKVKI